MPAQLPGPAGRSERSYRIGIALNVALILFEVTFGLMAGSLALISDAGHNLTDVLGLALAWAAARLARVPPTPRRTYGMRRSTILAALLNAFILLVAMGAIAWEAVRRLRNPQPVVATAVIAAALVGFVINSVTALLFLRDRKKDLNVAAAFSHMAADAAVSAGVVLSGIGILLTGWYWLDPVVSLVIVAVVLIGTWGVLREATNLALDAVPDGIDLEAVGAYLAGLPSVTEVHDLHVWAMSTTEVALTAHLVKLDSPDDDSTVAMAVDQLRERFGIQHATIQTEHVLRGSPCPEPCDDGFRNTVHQNSAS